MTKNTTKLPEWPCHNGETFDGGADAATTIFAHHLFWVSTAWCSLPASRTIAIAAEMPICALRAGKRAASRPYECLTEEILRRFRFLWHWEVLFPPTYMPYGAASASSYRHFSPTTALLRAVTSARMPPSVSASYCRLATSRLVGMPQQLKSICCFSLRASFSRLATGTEMRI